MKANMSFAIFSVFMICSNPSYSDTAKIDSQLNCNAEESLVLSSISEFIPAEGTFFTNGLFSGDGMNFQRNVMLRSAKEISKHRSSAIKYFEEKFGINLASSSIFFNGFEVMPEIEYHVLLDSQKKGIRNDMIQDGGWIAVVVDPNGMTLAGEFNGLTVPQGTMFVYGDYKINKGHRSEVIAYKSNKPFIPQFDGSFIASFDVQGRNGSGKAIATISPKISSNGIMTANIKNVLQLGNSCR